MATYTNTIPAKLAKNDIIKLTQSGTYALTSSIVANVTVEGAKGGASGAIVSTYNSVGGTWTQTHLAGAAGGNGGKVAANNLAFAGNLVAVIAAQGTAGAEKQATEPYHDPNGNVTTATTAGNAGGTAGATSLTCGAAQLTANGGGGASAGTVKASYQGNSGGGTTTVAVITQPVAGAGGTASSNAGGTLTTGGSAQTAGVITITVVSANQAPTTPDGLEYGAASAGAPITLATRGSTDPEGDAITYTYERQTDSGAWVQVAAGAGASVTDTVPTAGAQVRWRVKAMDNQGNESAYTTGEYRVIDYNHAPTVTLASTDLGAQTGAFSLEYSVDDADAGDTLGVTVTLDGATTLATVTDAVRGQTYTATVSATQWAMAATGQHTITVTVSDGKVPDSATAVWQRNVQAIDVQSTIPAPYSTGDMPLRIILVPALTSAPGSVQQYLACNNGYDITPAWEDITAAVLNGRVYTFANASKVADDWGVLVRAIVNKTSLAQTQLVLQSLAGAISAT